MKSYPTERPSNSRYHEDAVLNAYSSSQFMSVELLSKVVAEFDWPDTYSIEDNLPDGIVVKFPKNSLYFCEGFDGEIELMFLREDTGTDQTLNLIDALTVLIPNFEHSRDPFAHLDLKNDTSIYTSPEKVENGIRDICIIVNEYLRPYIEGDLSWVEKYKSTMGVSQ